MSSVSAEQSEEPVKSEHQYIPIELPQFKTKESPASNLAGHLVFLQDEQSRIERLRLAGQEASSVLAGEVESCRQSHQGHILRQQISMESCSVVEYRYQYANNDYSIFVNPSHGLVEDISGPVQASIEKMDALAQKAFEEKRYEDAYRLNLRSLCMVEASEEEKELRAKILDQLINAYGNTALLTWLVASLAWLFLYTTAPGQYGNFGAFFGFFPLLGGVYLFTRDMALRFQQRSFRRIFGMLLGLSAFLSGAPINIKSFHWKSHWVDWLPLIVVTLVLISVAIGRAKERSRRAEIEKHITEFTNEQSLESYVCGLDPKDGTEFRVMLGMLAVVFCLLTSLVGLAAYHASDRPKPAPTAANEDPQSPAEVLDKTRKAAEKGGSPHL